MFWDFYLLRKDGMEVEEMASLHPEIKQKIADISAALERYACEDAVVCIPQSSLY